MSMSKQRRRLHPDEFAAGPRPPLGTEAACELLIGASARAAILVEGWSDQAALESLALKRGWDLTAEGIGVVPMGGITNIGKFAQALGPRGLQVRLAGLCDAAEEAYVTQTLRRMGLGSTQTREEREALGFFVCEADLEDELIRALGTAAVERVLEGEGELASFRKFQEQPAQLGRSTHAHLRRFMGTRARRKIRYGSLLVEALPLERVPRALDLVLTHHRG
ncbi:MAG TPA: TOPRIM nucleotidyl transferase/hydrolase domain-containing protein [Ideonella sp.]|nr:TOPRIM nucleotidyl transferase/hydrolase domain-containing protein [Ideonella sp.]